ncbi:hypothetical protein F4553_002022 [Allocatelliglobosispora scoriae]|uniref:DUF397 domain-containing protein n=1 Tax=Allocatelliglobosispora scoriae TaxID=643052 RepID=A0A841BNW3_9ACTN|nr:DUF397 domain-containing protein [Allocatelliglobosispora scoriae]MBB5868643.1 hypothetical protein [Allocatelliglobosispora scoriae]
MRALNHTWRVSTRSGTNGACVEARYADEQVHLRDSKDREGGQLAFNAGDWSAFIEGVKAGEFDLTT